MTDSRTAAEWTRIIILEPQTVHSQVERILAQGRREGEAKEKKLLIKRLKELGLLHKHEQKETDNDAD